MNNLKPCPFCGGEAAIKEFDDGSGGVFCVECKFQPLIHASYNRLEDKQEAIVAWNRRDDGWIPVTERLPEEGDTVLMWHKDGFVMLALNMFDEMDDVSYWMPLPQPPETSKGIRKFTLSEFADAYAEIAPALCKAVAVDIKWTCVNCGYPNDADNIKCWACGQLRRE